MLPESWYSIELFHKNYRVINKHDKYIMMSYSIIPHEMIKYF
jgi:hypothetical protein